MKFTRRDWTRLAAGAALASRPLRSQETPVLIDNPKGNFKFVKGSGPYSSGAVAHPGYEVVHAIFNPLPSLWKAFDLIENHIKSQNRPLHALCGMELRIPKALSFEGFNEFNQPYIEKLESLNLHVDGLNPVARTNVAIEVNTVPEPSVFGFCYTVPSQFKGKTFVNAGAGELRSRKLAGTEIVRRGDHSVEGMREKASHVLGIMASRLEAMEVPWSAVTATNIYTVYNIHPLMENTIMPALHDAARHGIRWHFARPPIVEIDYEMDMRGLQREITLPG